MPVIGTVADIARAHGVQPDTVHKWIQRHPDFPLPCLKVAGARVWDMAEVAVWVEARR